MKGTKKAAKRMIGAVVCVLLLSVLLQGAAHAADGRTVTVACIDYDSFVERAADGTYAGFGADYLDRIAEYTGWEYEFVDMDWPTAFEAVKAGTVDFYLAARQTVERQPELDFSLYPIFGEEMNLYTLPDSEIYYDDYGAFDGLRVGMLEASGEIDSFRAYAEAHDFSCVVEEYPTNRDAAAALRSGAVDAIALVSYAVGDEFKLVASLDESPAYLMSREGSQLMREFSNAQEQLHFDDPDFSRRLEQTYYNQGRETPDLLLTRAEADFISSAEPLTVAVSVDMAPIEYYDEGSGGFKGVAIDLYGRISEMTGLSFRFVQRPDAPALIAKMESGELQLVGALAQSESVAQALQLTQTLAFSDNSLTLITKDMTSLTPGSVVAVPAGYPKFANTAKQNGYSTLEEFTTFEECVDAVYAGRADLTYVITMCEGYLLDHTRYSGLRAYPCADADYGICFGVYKDYDPCLISIINKCISAIPDKDVNGMIVTNTAHAKPRQTWNDLLVENGALLFAAGITLVALIAYAIIRSQRARQQQALNAKLREHHDFLQHLYDTVPCGVLRYSYEPPHRILSYNAACAEIYGYEDGDFPVIGETPDVVVEKGTEEAFQEQFRTCEEMGHVMYVWPVTKKDGSRVYTESVMDLVDTDEGKVFQEVVLDVTARTLHEQEIEKRYTQESNRRGNRDAGMLYTAFFDITEQTLTDTDIDVPGIHAGMSVAEFTDGLRFELEALQTPEAMADFETRFTLERLQTEYDNGHYEQSFNLCRRKDGQIQWLRSDLVLRLDPATGHLMCFDYIWDVTDERVTGEIMRRTTLADCDSFMSVYVPTGRCIQYEADSQGKLSRSDAVYGQDDLICSFRGHMSDKDALRFIGETELSEVEARLKDATYYQVYATLSDAEGARQDKELTYFYTDGDKSVLAVTVSDVTKIRADEVRHAQLLSDALAAAEKADLAKSQFLSRVSHEMRTPLNAIIGFIELAKDADTKKTVDLLASSDIAAKQLLNVINDVLDMSAIESGKMKISSASFNFRRLITAITNIYGTQCKQKGVDFQAVMEAPVEEWLIGDELRVNQILMNLLGNAVKFTSEGYIHLRVTQTELAGNKVLLRFVVSDTGCGMSGEMQQRLFKPFEQENASTARKYGGSGLGLSIVKNLVSAMGGSISVVSRQDEGSAFTVELPFKKSDIGPELLPPQTVESLRILTVDDEQGEQEYLSLVLDHMGVRHTSVSSGEQALEALEQSRRENDLFNVCLVDWRMPGMNGFDTTSCIRERYGEDVVVIVVSAYDFQHVGDNAMKAGANLFLSKPIFQSTVFDLLMTLTGGKIATVAEEPAACNFVGKRVLLVEDNPLNRIIAEANLEKYNLIVDIAENGQIAVDKFLASAPGYYDAILMDIQMPVMDGYEATRAIRGSDHPEAGTIQIIAQTADAFNEDIVRVLAAGMNAHVAKPINQEQLLKALQKAFAKEPQEHDRP